MTMTMKMKIILVFVIIFTIAFTIIAFSLITHTLLILLICLISSLLALTDSPQRRLRRLRFGNILLYLQKHNHARYHELLHELILDIHPLPADSLDFILQELQELEPDAKNAMQDFQKVFELIEKLQIPVDIRQLVKVAETVPFSFEVQVESVKKAMCEYASGETLMTWVKIGEICGIPKSDLIEVYLWKVVQDSQSR